MLLTPKSMFVDARSHDSDNIKLGYRYDSQRQGRISFYMVLLELQFL